MDSAVQNSIVVFIIVENIAIRALSPIPRGKIRGGFPREMLTTAIIAKREVIQMASAASSHNHDPHPSQNLLSCSQLALDFRAFDLGRRLIPIVTTVGFAPD